MKREIRFNGFVYDCNYDEARIILQEEIFKMYAENKKLKEIEKLYTQQVIDMDKLKEDLELSEKSCVEIEKENEDLKQQLEEALNLRSDIQERFDKLILSYELVISEFEKVNGVLTDTIIEITQDEFDANKLCYLEEISSKFCEKINQIIDMLEGKKDVQ